MNDENLALLKAARKQLNLAIEHSTNGLIKEFDVADMIEKLDEIIEEAEG